MNYTYYSDFILKYPNLDKEKYIGSIMTGRIKKSYLFGPKIRTESDLENLYKRIKSNCIYNVKSYKRISKRKIYELSQKLLSKIDNNLIIEISGNNVKYHRLISVPGDYYEK